jgi:hypothetical protein
MVWRVASNCSPKKKTACVTECYSGLRIWTDPLERSRQRKVEMRFGTWNVWSLYNTGSLKSVASELAQCDFDLVVVRKVRCDARVVASHQMVIHFSMEMGMLIVTCKSAFSYVRESYQQLRG